ncbi:putative MFS family arabinose efflux permease [Pseudonocardia sediminis]|uniref:Putative MFS family arabinose efflux permease n=1 Tax=Pseudonocardia sediminis TaxID=1397368 RepID=A0A4Q7UU62_PSEST|nr:MFS transporter [Pseudonocardia sediminis]RZT84554.1 putative MFS family arabinose efflux permease [Pseudonocardia sediminis]
MTAPAQRAVLREPAFLRLWTGTTASGLATWALPFVLGLAVLEGSLDAVGLGIVLGVRTAGFLAAVPISGVIADRYSRRAVVWWSGLSAAVASAAIAVGLGTSLWLMIAGAVVAGAGQGACRPAFQALVAEIVTDEQRQQANAAMTFSVRVTTLIAPAAIALLGTLLSTRALTVGIALLWLVAAVLPPRGTFRREAPAGAGLAFFTEFADGVREARRHPWFLAGLGALTTVIATGYSATGVALPLVSRDVYGSETVLAAALTGYTAGALLGAVIISRWRPHARGWSALAGLGVYAVAPLALLVPLPIAVVVAAYVVAGIGIELFNVPWFTAVQREVDPATLARVSSLDFLLSYGLAPLGLALIAPAIAAFGLAPVLLTCAVACVLGPGLAALVPGTRRFSREPARSPS